MTKLTKIVANFETQLATKISVSGTSATLQSIKDDDGNDISDGKYYLTIDGGTGQEEHFLCDNTAGSLTNLKSVSRQGVETSGAVREHRIGAEVKITDFAVLKVMTDLLNGDSALDSSSPLNYDANPTFTDDKELITKKYADDLAIAGSPDASTSVKGISKLSVAPASPTNPIATGTNDPRIPSQDENDALVGSSGTPSTSNKYITEDDVKTTPTASKIPRADGSNKLDTGWLDTGTGANQIVQLDGSSKLPAVDGSNLTDIVARSQGIATRDMSVASGDQVIAHGLGKTPDKVKITMMYQPESSAYGMFQSFGTYDGTNTKSIYIGKNNTSNQWGTKNDTTYIILYFQDNIGSNYRATISVDSTNITLSWTKNGSTTGTLQLLWEAEVSNT